MTKISVSKLVQSGTQKTVDAVSKVADKSSKAAISVANTSSTVVSNVAKETTNLVSKTANKTHKGVLSIQSKLDELCNTENIIPCITAITIIAYIVIVTPSTVLDIFSTKMGKTLSMAVVLTTLLFDLKLGILVGLAAILSISLASVNKELYETVTGDYIAENYSKPIDYMMETPDYKPCSKSVKVDSIKKENPIEHETVLEITGLDDHLKSFGILNQDS